MINFICFIISMIITIFFIRQNNYIFFVIESAMMIYYAIPAFEWFCNTFIKDSNENKFDEEYEQKLLEKQERENWHPRKDKLYLNSLNLKDIEWTGTEKKERNE